MEYLPLSFIGGVLTVLAPCVFTLLPIILGGSLKSGNNLKRPLIIILSLSISIILFTLLLKASTILISVDQSFWKYLSGFILIFLGLITLLPEIWDFISVRLKLSTKSGNLLNEASQNSGYAGDALTGFALGPVFSSCSPTYALVLATVLPNNFAIGFINLLAYTLGLALVLLAISVFGQQIINKFKWAANPKGLFKRVLGLIFILVGLMIIFGLDKKLEVAILNSNDFNITRIELDLLRDFQEK